MKTWNSLGEMLEKHISQKNSRNYFWATLDSQYRCSRIGLATKIMAINPCSPLKSSQLALPLCPRKSQRNLLSFLVAVISIAFAFYLLVCPWQSFFGLCIYYLYPHSFTYPFIHSFIHLSIHLSIHSFIHSFVHSFM